MNSVAEIEWHEYCSSDSWQVVCYSKIHEIPTPTGLLRADERGNHLFNSAFLDLALASRLRAVG